MSAVRCSFQLDREPTEHELEAYIKKTDLDADGRIDLNEYITSIVGPGWSVPADRDVREHLGISVFTLKNEFVGLCEELGFPVGEERMYGSGAFAGIRRPTVYDIKEDVLLTYTSSRLCSRDSRPGCALIDAVEAGGGDVREANLMLSYTWGYALQDIVDSLVDFCMTAEVAKHTYVWICFACINVSSGLVHQADSLSLCVGAATSRR